MGDPAGGPIEMGIFPSGGGGMGGIVMPRDPHMAWLSMGGSEAVWKQHVDAGFVFDIRKGLFGGWNYKGNPACALPEKEFNSKDEWFSAMAACQKKKGKGKGKGGCGCGGKSGSKKNSASAAKERPKDPVGDARSPDWYYSHSTGAGSSLEPGEAGSEEGGGEGDCCCCCCCEKKTPSTFEGLTFTKSGGQEGSLNAKAKSDLYGDGGKRIPSEPLLQPTAAQAQDDDCCCNCCPEGTSPSKSEVITASPVTQSRNSGGSMIRSGAEGRMYSGQYVPNMQQSSHPMSGASSIIAVPGYSGPLASFVGTRGPTHGSSGSTSGGGCGCGCEGKEVEGKHDGHEGPVPTPEEAVSLDSAIEVEPVRSSSVDAARAPSPRGIADLIVGPVAPGSPTGIRRLADVLAGSPSAADHFRRSPRLTHTLPVDALEFRGLMHGLLADVLTVASGARLVRSATGERSVAQGTDVIALRTLATEDVGKIGG